MLDKFNFREALGAITRKLRPAGDTLSFRSDIEVVVRDKDGNVRSRSFQHNARVNAGADFWNQQLFGVSGIQGQTHTAGYMALSTDTNPAGPTDTTLPSEL